MFIRLKLNLILLLNQFQINVKKWVSGCHCAVQNVTNGSLYNG